MNRPKESLILFLILPIIATSITFVQNEIDLKSDENKKIERFMFLPKGEYLKTAAIGYDQLVADVIWLRAIQVVGEKRISEEGYDWIYHALDVVTTLDPKFHYAYQVGGVILSTLGNKIDLSNAILEKGLRENPDVWQIPFYLGFNHFFHLDDYKKAAEYMTIASELPGRPFYVPGLAATLYIEEGDPEVALEFLERAYKETEDERIKKEIENKTREVIVARDIIFLEGGVKRYIEIYKKNPESLEDLVTGKIIDMIPKEPFGGFYYTDKETNEIKSSIKGQRIKLHKSTPSSK
jgi:tetratricopeptide (TPR) repeat protein